jgi:hypothetical protein
MRAVTGFHAKDAFAANLLSLTLSRLRERVRARQDAKPAAIDLLAFPLRSEKILPRSPNIFGRHPLPRALILIGFAGKSM